MDELTGIALIILAQAALIASAVVFIFKCGTLALSEGYDVPLVKTPHAYLPRIADALDIRADDRVYDIGSGDGRVVRYLARRFPEAEFVGIERNPLLVAYARLTARALPNARFARADMYAAPIDATRVFAYLTTKPLNDLYARGVFRDTRLVTRAFRLQERAHDASVELSKKPGHHGEHLLYVYDLTK